MLVERRKRQMSANALARIIAIWAAVSTALVLIDFTVNDWSLSVPLTDPDRTLPLVDHLIGYVRLPSAASQISLMLLLGISMLLAARLAWRLLGERDAMMACLVMPLSAPLLSQIGGHQGGVVGIQIICALTAISGFLARRQHIGGWIIGLALAVMIFISFESWPFAASICAIGAIKWLRNQADRMWLLHITQSMAVAMIAIFLALQGLNDFGNQSAQVSPIHLAMICWIALIISALSRAGPIPIGALLGGFTLAIGGTLGLFYLSMQGCEIVTRPIWKSDLETALRISALPIIAIWGALQLAARNVEWLRGWWFDYTILLILGLTIVIFTMRGEAILAALAAVPLGWQLRQWLDRISQIKNLAKRVTALALVAGLIMPSILLDILPLFNQARAGQNLAQGKAALSLMLPY